jgi:hypothetical protein
MANKIGNQVQRFPWMTPGGGVAQGLAGMTAEEMKIHQGVEVQGPSTAPIAQRAPAEFIQPSTSSETLRLQVPTAANPYATPTGPKHDHMLVRTALERSHSTTSGELVRLLKSNPEGVDPNAVGQMRASLSREHAMLGLLQDLQEMQEHIYGRIIGGQTA